MIRHNMIRGLVAALCIAAAAPALADNYPVKDATGTTRTLGSVTVSGVEHTKHLSEGLVGGTGAPQAVNVDSGGQVATQDSGATASSVPSRANYGGINVGGTLRGQTGVNPTGSIFAGQTDLSSVGGASVSLGQKVSASSVPVVLPSDQIVSTSQSRSIFWNDQVNQSLSSSATYTGTTRDVGVASGSGASWAFFNAHFVSTQAGTALVDCSADGTTWFTCTANTLTASAAIFVSVPVITRYFRTRVINGATGATITVSSSFTGS